MNTRAQVNTQNIPSFVLWIAASMIGAGILHEAASIPYPFAVIPPPFTGCRWRLKHVCGGFPAAGRREEHSCGLLYTCVTSWSDQEFYMNLKTSKCRVGGLPPTLEPGRPGCVSPRISHSELRLAGPTLQLATCE